MSEILDGFFDGFVYLVGAYLNKKVGIVALFSLVMDSYGNLCQT
jgi:hypothetical protein